MKRSLVKLVGLVNDTTKNGDRVSKSDKNYYICMISPKKFFEKYEKYGTLLYIFTSLNIRRFCIQFYYLLVNLSRSKRTHEFFVTLACC